MPGLPHYTEDPLMDTARAEHRLVLEPVSSGTSLLGHSELLYGAACSAGDWIDPRAYADQAHFEGFDTHMQTVQATVHAATQAGSERDSEHPNDTDSEA